MKQFLAILLFISLPASSQSWQWGRRGGGTDQITESDYESPEQVESIATDAQRNIFCLSVVTSTSMDIDGHPKPNYGGIPSSLPDYALSSFSCDGTYRWSKIFGGGGRETLMPLGMDNQENLYVAGYFANCNGLNEYPARIENDTILNQSGGSCSLLFISKFDINGQLLWFRRPQAPLPSSQSYSHTGMTGMAIEKATGTTHLLVNIPPGSYGNGAFTATQGGYYIFKYDSNGNFLTSIPLNVQLEYTAGQYLKFYRNPYNGHYIITGRRLMSDTAIINGVPVGHCFFMASFDENGTHLWTREGTNAQTGTGGFRIYNIQFDQDNNIYFGGRITGLNSDSFLGYSVPEGLQPGFVMKMNADASAYTWVSRGQNSGTWGDMTLNGNEIGFTGYAFGTNYTWGSQSLNINPGNTGQRALLARLDKSTGNCLSLAVVPAGNSPNTGSAIAVDAAGDYILGGAFGSTATFNSGTLTNIGGQSDFFLTKYATAVCGPLAAPGFSTNALKAWPNPVSGLLRLDNTETGTYILYGLLGQNVGNGILPVNASIDMGGFAKGIYVLEVRSGEKVQRFKIIRE